MKKKNAVAFMIILFICVAVYLNWNYTQNIAKFEPGGINTGNITDDDILVDVNKSEDQNKPDDEGNTELTSTDDYFTNARIERQKARDNALNVLRETVNEKNLSQEARDKAAQSMETLAAGAVSEARIETLIKAKGFSDCVTLINDKNVNVIVKAPKGGLTASDTAKIKDIVVSETNMKPSQINIVEKN
ncbi:MAG: SpoIIIAH-like family protein [Clostridiales bacterium]|nr:SpoIIIAH-like family protein [Clostridiales bacterium]